MDNQWATSLVLYLAAWRTQILFCISVHIITDQCLILSSVTMRCSCLGIMTPLSVPTMYCVTLKAWQADPKGQFWDMNASVYVCVCARVCVCVRCWFTHCPCPPPAVSCGTLCWEESITFSLAFLHHCVSTRTALCGTSSAQMLMHVALNALKYCRFFFFGF